MSVTVLAFIYNIILFAMTFGGCGYAVFVKDRSGWWFLLACMIYSTAQATIKTKELK